MSDTAASTQELKRLAPVAEAAANATTLAASLYSQSKRYVPERLQGTVEAAESRVATLASPYLPSLLDRSTSALKSVDAKVRRLCGRCVRPSSYSSTVQRYL